MRVDGILTVAGFALAGTMLPGAPLAVCVLAIAVCTLIVRHVHWLWLACAVALLALCAARATHRISEFERLRVSARDTLVQPERCELRGRVVTSPTLSAGDVVAVVDVEQAVCGDARFSPPLRVRLRGGSADLARGDEIWALADLGPLELYRNAGAANPVLSAARKKIVLTGTALAFELIRHGSGISAAIDRVRAAVRARIRHTYAPQAETLGRALVLGENDLAEDDSLAFKQSGLSHLLAVSGTHLVFAVALLVRALGFLLVRIEVLAARGNVARVAAAFGVVLSLAYADFAGGSGPAWRAAWMLSAVFLVQLLGYRPSVSRSLSLSILVGCICDPLCGFDLSFLLSVAATGGLLCIARPLGERAKQLKNAALRYFALSLSATTGAMLGCAPVLALLGSDLTLGGVLANVLAAPLGEAVALPLCLVHAAASSLPMLEHGLALCASGALLVVRAIAHVSASAQLLSVRLPDPNPFQLAVIAFGIGALLLCKLRSSRIFTALALVLALFALELELRNMGMPADRLRMTAIDVGQGDATLVDFPDGRCMLVDAGGSVTGIDPGARAVQPVLRARRRTRIDVVVLSHPHPDHFGGLLSIIKTMEVGEFWDSGQGQAEGAGPAFSELMRELALRGIPILRPAELCGRSRHFGAARVEVLGPCPGFTPLRNANDNSLVLSVSFGKRRILLSGDAEEQQEHELLSAHPERLHADMLKVAHHGSRTSSTQAFLSAVSPRVATIACGVRNRFGHPHQSVIERLSTSGVAPLRLDRVGSVLYQTDGSNHELFAASAPR